MTTAVTTNRDWVRHARIVLNEGLGISRAVQGLEGITKGTLRIVEFIAGVESDKPEWIRLGKKAYEITVRVTKDGQKLEQEEDGMEELYADLKAYEETVKRILEFIDKKTKDRSAAAFIRRRGDDSKIISKLEAELDSAYKKFIEGSAITDRIRLVRIERTTNLIAARQVAEPPTSSEDVLPASLRLPPEPTVFFGEDRAHLVTYMVSAICGDFPARFALLGAGGMGKSTTALVIFHHKDVVSHFKDDRFFIRCGAATDCSSLIGVIAQGLRLTGSELRGRVLKWLSMREHILLGLDEMETCLKDKHDVEEFLTVLASLPNLTLIITLRGTELPYGPAWTEPLPSPLEPLEPVAAKQTFIKISKKNDENLELLLKALGYHPLAVTLVAVQARGDETPTSLLARWEVESTRLLDRGEDHRAMSVNFSIRLSIECHVMTRYPDALPLLSLVAHLPDGLLCGKLSSIVPPAMAPQAGRSAATLRDTALAKKMDPSHDLLMHALVRAYVLKHHAPQPDLLCTLEKFYLKLVQLPPRPTDAESVALFRQIKPEISNLQSVLEHILRGISTDTPSLSLRAEGEHTQSTAIFSRKLRNSLAGLGLLQAWSGFGSTSTMELAVQVSQNVADEAIQAECLLGLAALYLSRGDHTAAKPPQQAALQIYERLGDKSETAACMLNLSNICRFGQQFDEAREYLDTARQLHKELGDKKAEANCFSSLANMFEVEDRFDEAWVHWDEALKINEEFEDKRAMANCLWHKGSIRQMQGQLAEARASVEEALQLNRELDNTSGEAGCLWLLGNICRMEKQYDTARVHVERALALHQDLRAKEGVDVCLRSLAQVLWLLGNNCQKEKQYDEARVHMERALALYQDLRDKPKIDICLKSLAQILWLLGVQCGIEKRYDEGLTYAKRALALYRELQDQPAIDFCLKMFAKIREAYESLPPEARAET